MWENASVQEMQSALVAENPSKNEAVKLLEEIAHVATKSPDSRKVSREKAVAGMRSRVVRLEKQWKELADELDDHMICLRKERKKRAESLLKSELELLAQIEEVVKSSQSATDAEELSEYLDVSYFH